MTFKSTNQFKKRMKTIGKTIKQLRKKEHITQTLLNEKTGIDRTYISRIEKGIANPSLKVMYALAKSLKKPITYFLPKSL